MVARKKPKGRRAQLEFEALSIEGGLLSPEWLARVASLEAGQQTESDYRVPKGLNLRDEISRYWRIAQAHYRDFHAGLVSRAEPRALSERFVRALLTDCFGFTSLIKTEAITIDERVYPIGWSALEDRVPVVIAPAPAEEKSSTLDVPASEHGDGTRRRSAFGLTQEYLNAADRAQWGLCSDGALLRILRDNASLTRPAWIEVDVLRIFAEERYADFTALWLLLHETRFGRPGQPDAECALESWRAAGREEGTRAREHLRNGVEEALRALGQGFVAHPDNTSLRTALREGTLTTQEYFQELLRLVYRLIFLLTVEERELLHPGDVADETKQLYAEGYSLKRLRERSVRRSAHDRFSDLWEATRIVLRGVGMGESRLGLPALAGIFAASQCPTLDAAKLENRALLLAVFKLAWLREDGSLERVNWRDMGPEELGSVYESLLELVPVIAEDGRRFAFAEGAETKGNARKTTGSYYTPDSLVQVLLDNALEPVIAETIAKHPGREVEALLGLSIVDPACGSGHFLLSAAERLADRIARIEVDGTPSPADHRHALRRVIGRCIYGVDLNPMAVELCKVGLWMKALEPGLPLTFLNSHIQHGNALLGTTPGLIAKGIPDAAWDPIEGDDKKVASALKKRNKLAASGQRELDLFTTPSEDEAAAVARAVAALEAESDTNVEALARKEVRWGDILGSPEYRHQRFVADAWSAAFVWPKQPGELADAAPTNALWRQLRDGQGQAPALTTRTVSELADQYRFFHWHLQFPQVFAKGGFDVVLGNPPWDALRLLEKEFFASRHPEIATAETSAKRKSLVASLAEEDPSLYRSFKSALRHVESANAFIVASGAYPLCGVGRVNLSNLFAERNTTLLAASGRAGFIVPTGIATDDSAKEYFKALVRDGRLSSLYDFRNHDGLFYDVGHRRFKFCLATILGPAVKQATARFVFFAESVQDLSDPSRQFTLTSEEIGLLNPRTGTCPIFRSGRDAEITISIYRRTPIFSESGWPIALKFPLDIGRESARFGEVENDDLLPLYEGKYFHHFDHHWLTHDRREDRPPTPSERSDPHFRIQPRHWYPAHECRERFAGTWTRAWLIAWRDIARSTDERTFIASLLPSIAVAHSAWLLLFRADTVEPALALLGTINSFAFDYVARQKVGGTHVSSFIVEQLPALRPSTFENACPWDSHKTSGDWIFPRVLELVYTAWDLEPFARDIGHDSGPFHWEPERRFQLRCELDAAFFHFYDLSRDDTDYVMNTFPIVRKNDEKAHGKYRTKRVILEIYDAMAEAARTGEPYQTRLTPPPADPSIAQSARYGGKVVPLPVKSTTRPQPAVAPAAVILDLAPVATNAWARPHTMERGEIQAVILAVLKVNGSPMDRRYARLASLLCFEPHLLASMLDKTEKAQWTRVVGGDARKAASASIDATSQEWGAALTGLRGRNRVQENLQQDTWALGTGTDAIDTTGWPEGRAGFVVNVLRRLQQSTQVDAIILKLPTSVQQWLTNAA